MYIPDGMTEEEVIALIQKISTRLSNKFKFGYHTKEDIAQQGFIFGMQGLQKYDNKRPLENFLWVHIRNRLKNYKRDEYERPDNPCENCIQYSDECNKHDDVMACKVYSNWYYRNQTKKNLMNPIGLSSVDDVQEQYMRTCDVADDMASYAELKQILDDHLPLEYRADYLKMTTSVYVPKHKREKIQSIIIEILEEHDYR